MRITGAKPLRGLSRIIGSAAGYAEKNPKRAARWIKRGLLAAGGVAAYKYGKRKGRSEAGSGGGVVAL
jgi:hypothetical protein